MANKKERYTFIGDGLTSEQKKEGKSICADYRKYYSVENYAQFQLLEELIFRELQQKEVKKQFENLLTNKDVKEKNLIPRSQWQALDDNLEKIIDLKERLGMLKGEEDNDFYSTIQSWQRKYKKHVMAHKADYTFKCPNCQEWIMAYIDLRKYGKTKHPYYDGNILYNKHLWKLVDDKKITAEDVAKILNVSKEYIPHANKGRKEVKKQNG